MIDPQIVLYMSGLAASLIMGIVTGFFLRNKRNVNLGKITVGVSARLFFLGLAEEGILKKALHIADDLVWTGDKWRKPTSPFSLRVANSYRNV